MKRYWLGLVMVVAACRGAEPELAPEPDDDSQVGAAGETASAIPESSGDLASSRPSAGGEPSAPSGEVGESSGEAGGPSGSCGGQDVTLSEIHQGHVRGSIPLRVGPLVASSQKFLVSEAKSGSCLWGAFAQDPKHGGAGSGLFLVSFGAPHAEGEACAAGSDGLPDDLKPGELLEVEGKLGEYVPASCDGTAAAQQLVVDAACPVRRLGGGSVPEPSVIDAALANRLALGKDPQLLRDWNGVLVRLSDVTALQDTDDGDAVFPFGVVRLEQTALEVHSRLYYFDLSEGGPRASGKAPHYGYPTSFSDVVGIVFLDYCSWVLAPRDRCADLEPASAGCAAQARGP